jgi:hypothetical protein
VIEKFRITPFHLSFLPDLSSNSFSNENIFPFLSSDSDEDEEENKTMSKKKKNANANPTNLESGRIDQFLEQIPLKKVQNKTETRMRLLISKRVESKNCKFETLLS